MNKFVIVMCMMMMGLGVMPLQAMHHRGGELPEYSHFERKFARMAKKVELTDAQKDKLEVVHKRFKVRYLDVAEELSPIRIKIKKVMIEEPVDYAQLRVLMERAAPLKIDLKLAKLRHRESVRGILTPSQRRKLDAHREKYMKKMKKKCKRKHHGGW